MNSRVELGPGCVQNKKSVPKKKTKKTKSHKDYCLNLEVFRAKKDKKHLFEMYDNLPLHPNGIRTLRYMHGCFFKTGNTKICPSTESIRRAIGLKTNRGIQKIIGRLVSLGFLIVEDSFDVSKPKFKQTTNQYHFTKLMGLHYKIEFVKKQMAALDDHINGFHTTKMMKNSAKKSKAKKEKQLEDFLSDYGKMEKAIKALPKRLSSVKAQKAALNRISPRKITSSSKTQENCYFLKGPRTPVQGAPVRGDTQTVKYTSKENIKYNVTPETVCNTSVKITPEIPQEDLNLIFKTYEEGLGKKLDEGKKFEFQVILEEAKTPVQEILERLKTFKQDPYLRATTSSINRVFYFEAALAARKQNRPQKGGGFALRNFVPEFPPRSRAENFQLETISAEAFLAQGADLVAQEDAKAQKVYEEILEVNQTIRSKVQGACKGESQPFSSLEDIFSRAGVAVLPGDSSTKFKQIKRW